MQLIYNYNNWWRWAPREEGGAPFQKVTFSGPERIIYVAPDVTELDVKIDIYSAWKEWNLYSQEAPHATVWPEAISVIGGEEIASDVQVGATFFLENGWRIQPFIGTNAYTLSILGNLYTREVGDNPFLFCDIEGGEIELLNLKLIPDLVKTELLVEVHEMYVENCQQRLLDEFKNTHNYTIIYGKERRFEDLPISCGILSYFASKERVTNLMNEGRPYPMNWIRLQPLN